MTHPTDYFCRPCSESGHGVHSQESGDAGLSSNMQHKFSDEYSERTLPVVDKGSFVIPIPKEEQDIFESPKMSEKIWSQPSSGRAAGPKVESLTVCAWEQFSTPSTVAVGQNNNFLSQTASTLSENNPEEDADRVLPRAAASAEEKPDVGVAEEDSCIKMDPGGNPEKQRGSPVDPGEVRNRTHHRKRAAGKNRKLYLLCLMVFIVPVSEAMAGVKCFTCKDKGRCPKLITIYDTDDHCLYKGAVNQTFPRCCEIPPPTPMTCTVCHDHSNINIICSEDVRKVEVEDSDGKHITNISPVCAQQRTCSCTCSAHLGLIVSSVLLLIVVAALVLACRCQRSRI
ncbi:uncharacterized protein LOC143325236 [Chaetodon auriga]|uniref:uncharacterized protein LOC143325236 n=1 Tax=Chaetodon auriga TaxID=39042 RepID=UPI004032FA0A